MKLLDSPWFLHMAQQQSRLPADRLVALFQVIGQWIAAPGVRELLAQQYAAGHSLQNHAALRRFLLDTAVSARAANPSLLASQLVILLQGAIAEELRNPCTQAMQGATRAAEAVVSSACRGRSNWQRFKLFGSALAASLLAGVLTLHGWQLSRSPAERQVAFQTPAAPAPGISADSVSAVLLLHDRLAQGICPSPQMLVLSQDQIAAYQRIVNLSLPNNADADWHGMRAFMDWYAGALSAECYVAPSNGHTTVAWVGRQTEMR